MTKSKTLQILLQDIEKNAIIKTKIHISKGAKHKCISKKFKNLRKTATKQEPI